MKAEKAREPGPIRSLMIAPFFSHKSITSRELLVSEVLMKFGTVDVVTTDFEHHTKSTKVPFVFHDGRTIHYLPTLGYRHNVSIARFLSYFFFSIRALAFYLKRKDQYDLVYASLPLNLLALLLFVASPEKIKIADVIDIWPDVLPFSTSAKKMLFPLLYFWKMSFARSVSSCDLLLAVSNRFMDQALRSFRGPISATKRLYPGCCRLARKVAKSNERLTIAYIGNIGHLYDFETLLAALDTRPGKTRVFLIGDGDRKDWLLGEFTRLKIEHSYFGVVYDAERLAEILAGCDIGFNGYRNTTAAFSYKASSYFSCGLPILNSMGGDLEQLVAEHGLGFNFIQGNCLSLLDCIDRCSEEVLATCARNVELFFQTELQHEVIKDNLAAFIGGFVTDRG